MTKAELKTQEKADKAAKKAADAAAKETAKLAAREAKVTKVTEPAADPLADNEVADVTDLMTDADKNIVGEKTASIMQSIVRSADSLCNKNVEGNAQDIICKIIRQSLHAYEIHVGRPFDTDLG